MTNQKLVLPIGLEPLRARIEATVKPAVKITAELHVQNSFLGSTFGGFPYLPKGFEYPKDTNGEPLTLLAQINWEEVPPLELYPRAGILQFYINRSDDIYGADFDRPREQKDWRVLYFPRIDRENYQTDFAFLGSFEDYYADTPLDLGRDGDGRNCLKLNFEKMAQPILRSDYQFDLLLNSDAAQTDNYSKIDDDVWSEYGDLYSSFGHRVGGYAGFTQSDPREYSRERGDSDNANPWLLLLQVDTDDGIMWGDSGVGNFFIKQKDLQALNFSNVWYNWDCM